VNMQVTRAEADNEPFHALEAEQALIAAVLHDNKAYGLVRGRIGPEHFFEHLHARLWEAIGEDIDAGREASYFSLVPRFRDDATMKELGGVRYISSLYLNVITTVNAPGYADKIVEAYRIREGRQLADELADAIDAGDMDQVSDIRKALSDIYDADRNNAPERRHIADVTDEVVGSLNDVFVSGVKPEDGAPCGSPTLTKCLGSWKRGCFYVLAGRPSMGKTTVGLSWMLRAARDSNVLLFSLEMSREQLARRALSDISYAAGEEIEYQSLETFDIDERQMERLCEAQRRFRGLRLQIDERAGLTVQQIRAAAAKEKQRLGVRGEKLDIVCIDHMGIMGVSDRYKGNPVNELAEISGALKVMAKELDCAVIALMQLNRGVESRDSKRPGLSDIRGSGAIEQDADVVMFVYREAYYLERQKSDDPIEEEERERKLERARHQVEIDIAKNRHGACRRMEFFCAMGCSAIRDISRRDPGQDL
jgi:replicative DNA helicase